jgi:hypothetical protein
MALCGKIYSSFLVAECILHSTFDFFHGERDETLIKKLALDIGCGADNILANNNVRWSLYHIMIIVSCTIDGDGG